MNQQLNLNQTHISSIGLGSLNHSTVAGAGGGNNGEA